MTPSAEASFFQWVFFLAQKYASSFLRGAGVTLLLALTGTLIGCLIGMLVGTLRTIPLSPKANPVARILHKIMNAVLIAYIEFFRGTPMIVQACVLFYGSAQMFGWDMSPMVAGFIIVSINTGAYMAESVRGGIQSVDIGQTEAAKAIGMTHMQTMLSVVLPQALRNILPQIGNNLIINIKDTSVLSIISVTELFFSGKSVSGAYYRMFESYFIICIIYLVMTLTASKLLRMWERKMDGPDNYSRVDTDPMADPCGHNPIKTKGGMKR